MEHTKEKKGFIAAVVLFVKGIVVGVANIIPGVSGGTIAVIVGIFDRLIEAVNTLFRHFKQNMKFLIPVALGAGAGIIGLSRVMEYCLGNHFVPTNFFFVGLVAGSIPLIYKKATVKSRFRGSYVLPFLLGAASVILLAVVQTYVLGGENAEGDAVVSRMTVGLFFQYLLGGAISSIAMVVPGISGSLVMVLINLYDKVIGAINGVTQFSDKDLFLQSFLAIIPIGLGILLGIITVAKLIEFLLKKYYSATYFAIFGLMVGSFAALLINMKLYEVHYSVVLVFVSLITVTVGFFTSYFLGRE